MFEKLGNWYVFRGEKMFKIHEKHVSGNKITAMKISEGYFYSRTYTLELIDIYSIIDVSWNWDNVMTITCINLQKNDYKIDHLQSMNEDEYEDMVEMEKLKKQVKELSDYVYSAKTLNDLA